MKWSPQQDRALREVAEWYEDPSAPQTFYLAGYAGTGKTTLARHLAQDVDGLTLFAAYTGKAASVLRQRGCPEASTLHSIIYNVSDRDKKRLLELQKELKEYLHKKLSEQDPVTIRELEREIAAEMKTVKQPWFSVNPESVLSEAALLVLDECSMVDKRLGKDVESFGKKILVLGDPAQLPPVLGGGYFTARKPNILLTEIHRQAADNPIIRWSKIIREGGTIPHGEEGPCWKVRAAKVGRDWYASPEAGQLLTGKNETRRKLNVTVRGAEGYRGLYPRKGERLVVLRNDKDLGVLNGVVCSAADDAVGTEDKEFISLDIRYEGSVIENVPVQASYFDAYVDPKAAETFDARHLLQMDFGYALTVHKSQGSQWKTVTLVDDGFGKRDPGMRKKWLYTAITRAEEKLTIVA